jgi:hypothetical protein
MARPPPCLSGPIRTLFAQCLDCVPCPGPSVKDIVFEDHEVNNLMARTRYRGLLVPCTYTRAKRDRPPEPPLQVALLSRLVSLFGYKMRARVGRNGLNCCLRPHIRSHCRSLFPFVHRLTVHSTLSYRKAIVRFNTRTMENLGYSTPWYVSLECGPISIK